MRNALVAVDAGHAALRHGLVRTGRHRRLFRERHGLVRMTAAALGGVVRFQFRPDFLRELQAVTFILCGRVELTGHVTPDLGGGLNMPHQARQECRRHVAVAAACPNTELIRIMNATRVFLERRVHFVAGGAERIGFRIFEAGKEAAREANSDDESEQTADRYSEQEPALRAPPEPRGKPPVRRLRRIHCEPSMRPCSLLRYQTSLGQIIYSDPLGARENTRFRMSVSVRWRTNL